MAAKVYEWEARAVAMYRLASKPTFAIVAFWLQAEGHASATDARVRRYLIRLGGVQPRKRKPSTRLRRALALALATNPLRDGA